MKKLFKISLIFVLISFLGALSSDAAYKQIFPHIRLLQYNAYKNIYPENIKSLKIIRFTEGGASEKIIEDNKEINKICNYLNKLQISGETQMSCTDNTTIYSFTLKDDTKVSIELECNWVVIKGKNYNLEVVR